jgi:hypothetical protein
MQSGQQEGVDSKIKEVLLGADLLYEKHFLHNPGYG